MSNPWFRLYAEAVDDDKLRLLAFEDRWHFVALLCCKCQGVLDTHPETLDRRIAVKLGLQFRETDELKRRLMEADLIGENWQPNAWDKRQFTSDSSADRTRKWREKKKKTGRDNTRNVTVTSQHRHRDGIEQNRTDTEQNINTTTPTPPSKSDPEEDPEPGGSCGGGEMNKNSKDETQEKAFSGDKPDAAPGFIWPVKFGESEKQSALKILKPFTPALAQDVLDELAAQMISKAINKPLAYLRTLAKKAKAGEFELEAGIPFRDSREARRRRDEALAQRDREEKARIGELQAPEAAPASSAPRTSTGGFKRADEQFVKSRVGELYQALGRTG